MIRLVRLAGLLHPVRLVGSRPPVRLAGPLAVFAAVLAGGCLGGGDGATYTPQPTLPASPVTGASAPTSTTPTLAPTPVEPPEELRIAYINLLSPIPLDAENTAPTETYQERLALIIEDLKAFDPDVVGISEATITAEHGAVANLIAAELGMETFFGQSNPWQVDWTQKEAIEIAEQNGWNRDGVAILVRPNRYPIVAGTLEVWPVNPSWTQNERQAVMHLAVQGPEGVGEISLFISRFIGEGDARHAQQADSVARFVERTRSDRPAVLMGDFNEGPTSATLARLMELEGLVNQSAPQGEGQMLGTCCRPDILASEPLPQLEQQTSYIFGPAEWPAEQLSVFGEDPVQRADGTYLYASDHNGIFVRLRFDTDDDTEAGD